MTFKVRAQTRLGNYVVSRPVTLKTMCGPGSTMIQTPTNLRYNVQTFYIDDLEVPYFEFGPFVSANKDCKITSYEIHYKKGVNYTNWEVIQNDTIRFQIPKDLKRIEQVYYFYILVTAEGGM